MGKSKIVYQHSTPRGYFGIGVEGISKAMNLGNLFRTGHAFGASFAFTINAHYSLKLGKSDTSGTPANIPFFNFDAPDDLVLGEGCTLIGIEMVERATDLPSFYHPRCAAYVLGPERGELSPRLMDKCSQIVQIPAKFCINVATAGAIVMYDRLINRRQFPDRPIGGTSAPTLRRAHVHGSPKRRTKDKKNNTTTKNTE